MRHSWKQKNYRKKNYEIREEGSKILNMIKVVNTFECINCGLRKGTTRNLGFYPVSVYFDDADEIISTHTIPYTCKGIKGGAYFDEDEFKI